MCFNHGNCGSPFSGLHKTVPRQKRQIEARRGTRVCFVALAQEAAEQLLARGEVLAQKALVEESARRLRLHLALRGSVDPILMNPCLLVRGCSPPKVVTPHQTLGHPIDQLGLINMGSTLLGKSVTLTTLFTTIGNWLRSMVNNHNRSTPVSTVSRTGKASFA